MSRFVLVVPEPRGPVVRRFDDVEQALKAVVHLLQHIGVWKGLPGDEGVSVWKQDRKGWGRLA